MKKLAVFLMILGALTALIGFVGSLVEYPTNFLSASGPTNTWELLLMLTSEGLFLQIGIGLIVFGLILAFAGRRREHE